MNPRTTRRKYHMAVCTGPSEKKIDQFSRMLAGGVSRRDALKWAGASVIGAMLVSVGVKQAEAGVRCPNPGVCGSYSPCGSTGSCYCGTTSKPGVGFCFQDDFCDSLIGCNTNRDCKAALGKGHKCLVGSCCDANVCVAKCSPSGSSRSTKGSGKRASG
jgi:hypothetical protein